MVTIRGSDVPGVYTDGEALYTVNLVPGTAVYGERLVSDGEQEYRAWHPGRSKLAAFLRKGIAIFPFRRRSQVLYLGAAQGTTVSHISDLCPDGMVFAVEKSPRAFQALVALSEDRPNVLPILADAANPEEYERVVNAVDVLYQDIAQRDQVDLFRRNLGFLRPGAFGILMIKARSADTAAKPQAVYKRALAQLKETGMDILQVAELDPLEVDHAAILMERP